MLRSDTFGAGWTAESLANLEIGMNPGRSVSYRFRADHDGAASAVRVFFVFRTICSKGCYAAGDGGAIRVEIRADNGTANHLPASTVLDAALVADPLAQWNRLVQFPQAAPLLAGFITSSSQTSPPTRPRTMFPSTISTRRLTAPGCSPRRMRPIWLFCSV
jgi:hypothetical protein